MHSQTSRLLLTSDPGHGDDLPLHHVIDVEEFVPHACGHHLLSISTETCLIHREVLQVDALDLWIGLTVHLTGDRTEALDSLHTALLHSDWLIKFIIKHQRCVGNREEHRGTERLEVTSRPLEDTELPTWKREMV